MSIKYVKLTAGGPHVHEAGHEFDMLDVDYNQYLLCLEVNMGHF